MTIRLARDEWEAALLPSLGGAVARLRCRGRDVLRPTPIDAADPLGTACFPMLPYANRVAEGRLSFGGKAWRLPRNFGDHPHSLHGVGWQAAWEVEEAGASHALLSLAHTADARWPWSFHATQGFELDAAGLVITLAIRNLDDGPVPAGLGLHPYFPADEATRLHFVAAHMLGRDETMLPTEPVEADRFGDWARGSALPASELVDNAFDGWDGRATIAQEGWRTLISAEGARGLHLYAPPRAGFVCLEPVSHLPDAFNRGDRFDILAPGETARLSMRISVYPLESGQGC